MNPYSAADTNASQAAGAYVTSSVENAPPVKLVRLLYQGAIRFLDRAAQSDPNSSDGRFAYWLGRSEDIVIELRLALDAQAAPQIAESLTDLYLFVEHEIQVARRERDVSRLAGARAVLAKLLEAWSAIDTAKS